MRDRRRGDLGKWNQSGKAEEEMKDRQQWQSVIVASCPCIYEEVISNPDLTLFDAEM